MTILINYVHAKIYFLGPKILKNKDGKAKSLFPKLVVCFLHNLQTRNS